MSNFRRMMEEQNYYIDKSMFISHVLRDEVSLYTRPRRFGKSMNMSMLYYFFSIKEKDNAHLFDHLKITADKEAMKHQNRYPVINLSLKTMIDDTFELNLKSYQNLISNYLGTHLELLDLKNLDEYDRMRLKELREQRADVTLLKDSLRLLTECLYKYYHARVIILIDEYDVPLKAAYEASRDHHNTYYQNMTSFLRSVLLSALKDNEYLERAVFTGCLRIAKESIFTGMNNFHVYSLMDPVSAVDFGFTQEEMDETLRYYHLEKDSPLIKEWYDGYSFGGVDIYNPWSTFQYLFNVLYGGVHQPQAFWVNTSDNSIVRYYLSHADAQMKDDFEQLMQGNSIKKRIKENLTYQDMDDRESIYSFLLYTGYLKAVQVLENQTFLLTIPNKEVKQVYEDCFYDYFKPLYKKTGEEFFQALLEENVMKAIELLNNILIESISYYDAKESFYHGFLAGLLHNDRYELQSNHEAGRGRFDLALIPRLPFGTGIIIECKYSRKESDLFTMCDSACAQIVSKEYVKAFTKEYNMLAYGIAFAKKKAYIKEVRYDLE